MSKINEIMNESLNNFFGISDQDIEEFNDKIFKKDMNDELFDLYSEECPQYIDHNEDRQAEYEKNNDEILKNKKDEEKDKKTIIKKHKVIKRKIEEYDECQDQNIITKSKLF